MIFSVVIPTRNRPRFARRAVEYALAQSFSDFEVVVLENSDAGEQLDNLPPDPRVSVYPTVQVLPMPDNWERLFQHARGRFVVLQSDKDCLIPSALETLWGALENSACSVAQFGKAAFHDPDRFSYPPASPSQTRSAAPTLARWFAQLFYDPALPMLYNTAVERTLLDRIRAARGRFFAGLSPEISSSIVLLASIQEYREVGRALAVTHMGSWSHGSICYLGRHHPHVRRILQEAGFQFGQDDPFTRHDLILSVTGAVVESLLACQEAFPALLRDLRINWSAYPLQVAREVTLFREEQAGLDTAEEWNQLRAGVGTRYTRSDFSRAVRFRRRRRLANHCRSLFPSTSLRGRRLRRMLSALKLRRSNMESVTRELSVPSLDEAVHFLQTRSIG